MVADEAKTTVPGCWTQAARSDTERSSPGYGCASPGLKSCPTRWRQVAVVGSGAEWLGFGENAGVQRWRKLGGLRESEEMVADEAKTAIPGCWTQAACSDAERSSPGYGGASSGLKSCLTRWRQVAAVGSGVERLRFGENDDDA
ncbi:hypothetical protein Droror1_Dr00012766 [Drosera rotundifolia]